MVINPFELLKISLVIFLAIIIVIILLHFSRKRDAASVIKEKTKNLMVLSTELSPNEVITTIVDDVSPIFGYKVEVVNHEKNDIILSTPDSLFSWGFFYPIYVTSQNDGTTLVEIGIRSKLFQRGPIQKKYHRKCFHAIKNVITTNKK